MRVRLALSGSGFLAPIHAGAICAFMDSGVQILEVAGTSGGSIAAALVASGKTAKEIKRIALKDIPADIMSLQWWKALFQWGMNDGSVLRNWLEDSIGPMTLKDVKVPITIIASDTQTQNGIAFTPETHPDLTLYDACRMSASVPGVWAPVVYGGKRIADGGMVANVPTDHLKIDAVKRIGIQVTDGNTPQKMDSLLDFAKGCVGTMLNANEGNLVAWAKQTGAAIIPVDARPYGFLDASLNLVQKADLFHRGYSAVTDYLG